MAFARNVLLFLIWLTLTDVVGALNKIAAALAPLAH
jgi:hypothetical protein